ncbi:hypothetical protein DV736_g4983, partial [Chaetothyriales sp. CBS 134916]
MPGNGCSIIKSEEIARHTSLSSCWIIIKGQVYDITDYLPRHPGGEQILLRYAGKDATALYEPIHPEGTIEQTLPSDKHIGSVESEPTSIPTTNQQANDSDELSRIPLSHCVSLDDVQDAAQRILSRSAWVFLHSAADSLGSFENNRDDWKKVTLRPRIMRNVRRVNMERTMFGQKCKLPFFIAPAARAKLVHPRGELCFAKEAAEKGICYCPSAYSTILHADLAEEMKQYRRKDGYGTLVYQLYVAHERETTVERVRMAREVGCKGLVITVDSPVVGKREEDERYRAELVTTSGDATLLNEWMKPQESDDGPPLRGHHSSTFNWHDLTWIREVWQNAGPIALKGVQTAEDAALAVEYDIDAVYLSNHGGRQCDDAPSAIHTLLEIRKFYPEIIGKVDIYLDGGVRRGADVIKALCLGATGVGLGRPFMYGVSMGDEGVAHVIRLLSEELETTMRNMGVTSLDQLNPSYVNTKKLESELLDRLGSLGANTWLMSNL